MSVPRRLTVDEALDQVDRYRGSEHTSGAVVAFTRDVVRQAVVKVESPVTKPWVRFSTSVVGSIASACVAQGYPLEPEVVLARERADAWLANDCRQLGAQTRSNYRSRIDVIAKHVIAVEQEAWPRAALSSDDTRAPYTPTDVARIVAWLRGVHPRSRHHRTTAVIALSLGCGLRRHELADVTTGDVTRDQHGVHVAVPPHAHGPERVVTCTAAWEDTLWELREKVDCGLLVAPGRASLQPSNIDRVTNDHRVTSPVPLTIQRLRNTWLARHILAGVPLPHLMEQAGLKTMHHIEDLLQVKNLVEITTGCEHTGQDAVAHWMRSAT